MENMLLIPNVHGFYNVKGEIDTSPNDKYLFGDTYEKESTDIYVHADNALATVVREGFVYDKCSKAFLKRGGELTAICGSHDGWFGAEFLSFIKANNEMFRGMRKLNIHWFKCAYHWFFTTAFGYPFRWYQEKFNGVNHSDEAIKEAREYVRLYEWQVDKWVDVTDQQTKWDGGKLS